jgi:hypothetical protein
MTYYGKYRGTVANNLDPLGLGRVQVAVPAIFGDVELSWAMPCAAFSGDGEGLFAVPSVGAKVWVEFEGGDPDYPICAGGFWGAGEAPADPADPTTTVLARKGVTLTINTAQGSAGLTIAVGPPVVSEPLTIALVSSGITLTNQISSVSLKATSVSINDGALEVR